MNLRKQNIVLVMILIATLSSLIVTGCISERKKNCCSSPSKEEFNLFKKEIEIYYANLLKKQKFVSRFAKNVECHYENDEYVLFAYKVALDKNHPARYEGPTDEPGFHFREEDAKLTCTASDVYEYKRDFWGVITKEILDEALEKVRSRKK